MALLDDLLKLLGTNRTRMQWKLRAWRRAWDRRFSSLRNRSHALTYEHQTCPACGHPAGADERTCTRCNEPLGGKTMHRARRLFAMAWLGDAPVVATLLLFAIGATYAATVLWSRQHGLFTSIVPSWVAIERFGGMYTEAIDRGEWWRLLTGTFPHLEPLHLAFNAISLWSVASYLEQTIGKAKTFALYIALGIVASLTSYAHYELTTGVGASAGASGAVCGLIGVAIGFSMRRRNVARHMLGRYVMWAVWIGIMALSSWRIDNWAHFGGLVPGFAIGLLVRRRADTSPRARRAWNAAAALALGVTVAAFVLAAGAPPPILPSS